MLNGSESILSKIAGWDFQSDVHDVSAESPLQAQVYQQLQEYFSGFFSYFEGIARISKQLDKVVQDFKKESDQVGQVAAFLKKGAEQQTADIQNSMKLVEDFSGKINEMYDKSRNIISLAYNMEDNNKGVFDSVNQLVANQQRNDEAVAEIFEVISRIITKTQKIGEITKLINRISSETNLLGLNAKVEAVHAGAAGKGFAVVAEEIQRLSKESKEASVSISDTIDGVTNEIVVLQNVAKKSQGIFADQRDSVVEVSGAIKKNSSFISTYIDEQQRFSTAIDKIKEDEHTLIASISSIFKSVREVSATSYAISSLMFNQNNSIMQLSKLGEDIAAGVNSLDRQKQGIRANTMVKTRRKIAVIFNMDIDFFHPPRREAIKAAETYNYDVAFFAPKSRGAEGVREMAGFIDRVIEERYDGLVISPLEDKLIMQKLRQLGSTGTKIIFIDSKLSGVDYTAYIETNGQAAGAAAARVVLGAMGNKGDVIVNTWSDVQISAIEDRKKGFIEELGRKSDIQVHEMPVASNTTTAESESIFDSMLRQVPDAKFVFLTNCEWGLIFANYMRKRRPDIQVISMDFTKDIQNAMKEGLVHYAVGQRAYCWGSMSIEFLDKCFGNKPVKKYVDTGTYEVNVQNMNIYESFI